MGVRLTTSTTSLLAYVRYFLSLSRNKVPTNRYVGNVMKTSPLSAPPIVHE